MTKNLALASGVAESVIASPMSCRALSGKAGIWAIVAVGLFGCTIIYSADDKTDEQRKAMENIERAAEKAVTTAENALEQNTAHSNINAIPATPADNIDSTNSISGQPSPSESAMVRAVAESQIALRKAEAARAPVEKK